MGTVLPLGPHPTALHELTAPGSGATQASPPGFHPSAAHPWPPLDLSGLPEHSVFSYHEPLRTGCEAAPGSHEEPAKNH